MMKNNLSGRTGMSLVCNSIALKKDTKKYLSLKFSTGSIPKDAVLLCLKRNTIDFENIFKNF